MDIREELLAHSMAAEFRDFLSCRHIDWEQEIESVAVKVLSEVQKILVEADPTGPDPLADFKTIERIMEVFQKYDLHTGCCHDFS